MKWDEEKKPLEREPRTIDDLEQGCPSPVLKSYSPATSQTSQNT